MRSVLEALLLIGSCAGVFGAGWSLRGLADSSRDMNLVVEALVRLEGISR